MVLTEILLKIPYGFAWRLTNGNINPFPIVFYCTDYLDYLIFAPIQKYLPEMTIVAKNKKVQAILSEKGISSILWPVYPKVLIMARHATHMFPSKKILKIGMRHGAYNFKKFIAAEKYNKFNMFLFTSEHEVETSKKFGIKNGISVGFPKIDSLHNNSILDDDIEKLINEIGFKKEKKTILFSATWNKSGISAIDKWYEKLDKLTDKYNVLVTVHPFTDNNIKEVIKNTPKIYFIENDDLNPFLVMADLLICDTSSIIAEFNSMLKPIISFKVEEKGRLNPEIIRMLEQISTRISTFEELINVLEESLEPEQKIISEQKKYNEIMFSNLDGSAGKESAKHILKEIENAGISF